MKKIITSFVMLAIALGIKAQTLIDGIWYRLDDIEKTAVVAPGLYSGDVTIPSEVINDGAKYSVTGIEEKAFWGLRNLTSVTVSEGISSIGNEVFASSWSLTSVKLPNGLTSIGDKCFYDCYALVHINIPSSVTNIGSKAFERCSSLPEAEYCRYADTYLVEAVDKYRTSYHIKEGTRFVGSSAFYYCLGLESITIPSSIISIEDNAFCSCSNLKNVTIREGVTCIEGFAFNGCSNLTRVNIPSSVTTIGERAFSAGYSLPVINGCRYADTYLVEVMDRTLSSYHIKEGTRFIGSEAFYKCVNLTNFVIPQGIINIGTYAFFDSGLTSITIPSSVTSISDFAFKNCNLKNVNIPSSVTSLGKQAFCLCSALTSVTIPASITSIGDKTFFDCVSIKDVINMSSIPQEISYRAFNRYTATLHVPAGSMAAYQAADYWKNFTHIVEDAEALPVEDIVGNGKTSSVQRYDINGRAISGTKGGIQIIRTDGGRVRKVLVKKSYSEIIKVS